MAYETGTATSIEDLVGKLFTFATGLATTPWTQDNLDNVNNYGTLHRGDCYVSFRWDGTTQTQLGLYQSLGYAVGLPHLNTNDSGNGDTTVPIDSGRRVNFESVGPFTKYYFFAGEGATPYIHVVVEVDTGRFRHFGFGNLIKFGTWTGGEYCYGHYWSTGDRDNPQYVIHSFGLDGAYTGTAEGATLHIEGMPDQGGSEKWAVFSLSQAPAGTDRAGQPRKTVVSGWRGGFWGGYLAWMRYSTPNAYKPLFPMPVVYRDQAAAPDTWRWIGEQPDVALVNMGSFTPGQEITVGAETWMVFPWVRKQYLLNNTEETWNGGIAYKKVA